MRICGWMMLWFACVSAPAIASNEPPAGAIVWWSFDPTRFEHPTDEPRTAAFLPILRAGVSAGLFGDGTEASILEGLLAAGEVGRAPHTLAIIDFEAEREDDNAGMRVQRLQAVLEIRTGEGHDRYLRTIKGIAIDAPRAKDDDGGFEAAQQRIDLPGGRRGVALRDNADAEWEQLAWCSEPGVFTIGYGVGALEAWFEREEAQRAAWDNDRTIVNNARPDGEVVLEAYVSIDALRERFPEAFGLGRTPRMLQALGLVGASSVMLHGRFVSDGEGTLPLLVLDETITHPAAESIEHRAWTLDAWPDDLARLPVDAGATHAIIATPEWPAFVEWGIAVHNATIKDNRLAQHMAEVDAWREQHGQALDRLLGTMGEHLIMTDAPQPPAPVPGLTTVIVPMTDATQTGPASMSTVLKGFSDRVRTKRDGSTTTWTYSIDSGELIRLPMWTIRRDSGRAVLIGGWGAPCLRAGARWHAIGSDDGR